jgi:CRP-like cAMP-binding protein
MQVREITRILHTPPETRSPATLEVLHRAIAHFSFFRELSHKFNTEQISKELCKYLLCHKLTPGQTLSVAEENAIFVVLNGKLTKKVRSRRADLDIEDSQVMISQGDYFSRLFEKRCLILDVEALEPTTLVSVKNEHYIVVLSQFETARVQDLMTFIASIPSFSSWTKSLVEKLVQSVQVKNYLRNQVVYQEGDKATDVYIIKRGEFKFTKQVTIKPNAANITRRNSREGSRTNKDFTAVRNLLHRMSTAKARIVEIALLGAKEIFGEDEVMNDSRRQTTCVCTSVQSEVIIVRKVDFFKRMTHPVTFEMIKGRSHCIQDFHKKRLNSCIQSEVDYQSRSVIASPVTSSRKRSSRTNSLLSSAQTSVKHIHFDADDSQTSLRFASLLMSDKKQETRQVQAKVKKIRRTILVPKLEVLKHHRVRSCKMPSYYAQYKWRTQSNLSG